MFDSVRIAAAIWRIEIKRLCLLRNYFSAWSISKRAPRPARCRPRNSDAKTEG